MAFSRALQTGDTRDRDIVQVCMPTAVLRMYMFLIQYTVDSRCNIYVTGAWAHLHTLPEVHMNR